MFTPLEEAETSQIGGMAGERGDRAMEPGKVSVSWGLPPCFNSFLNLDLLFWNHIFTWKTNENNRLLNCDVKEKSSQGKRYLFLKQSIINHKYQIKGINNYLCKWFHISPASVWARVKQPAPRAPVMPGIESAGNGDLMPEAANWNKSSSVSWSSCLFRWNVSLHFQSLLFSAVLKRVNIVEWFPHINI